jgi:hypothetical protein
LFGSLEQDKIDMGEMGTYFIFKDGSGKVNGGMSNAAKFMNFPPSWLHYITVVDIEATLARLKTKGGKVMNGPMPVPGGGIIAQCTDPQGASFGLYQLGVS